MCSLFQVSSVLCNNMSILFYPIVCQSNFILLQADSILFYYLSNLFFKKSRGWGWSIRVADNLPDARELHLQAGQWGTESKIVLQACPAITPQRGSRHWVWNYQLRGRIRLEMLPLHCYPCCLLHKDVAGHSHSSWIPSPHFSNFGFRVWGGSCVTGGSWAMCLCGRLGACTFALWDGRVP